MMPATETVTTFPEAVRQMKEATWMSLETFTPEEYADYFYLMGLYPGYLDTILRIEESQDDVFPSWEAVPSYLEEHLSVKVWCAYLLYLAENIVGGLRYMQGQDPFPEMPATVSAVEEFPEKGNRDARILKRVAHTLASCVQDSAFDRCFDGEPRLKIPYALIVAIFFALFLGTKERVVAAFKEMLNATDIALDVDTIASINTWHQLQSGLPQRAITAIGTWMLRHVVLRRQEYI